MAGKFSPIKNTVLGATAAVYAPHIARVGAPIGAPVNPGYTGALTFAGASSSANISIPSNIVKGPKAVNPSSTIGRAVNPGYGGGNLSFVNASGNATYAPRASITMPPSPVNSTIQIPFISSDTRGSLGAGAFFSQLAIGAVTGGATSYYTGGSFTQGAIAGAAVGAGLGAFAGSGLVSGAANRAAFMIPSQASTHVHRAVTGFENAAYRRYAIGAGAALGGFTFGGQRNHKRGFNRDRGNTIRR